MPERALLYKNATANCKPQVHFLKPCWSMGCPQVRPPPVGSGRIDATRMYDCAGRRLALADAAALVRRLALRRDAIPTALTADVGDQTARAKLIHAEAA